MTRIRVFGVCRVFCQNQDNPPTPLSGGHKETLTGLERELESLRYKDYPLIRGSDVMLIVKSTMNTVGEREKQTQARVINFFRETLGYLYLGRWQDREGNSNIETRMLADWLRVRERDDQVIRKAVEALQKLSLIHISEPTRPY